MNYTVSDFIKGYIIALLWSEVREPEAGAPSDSITDEHTPDELSQTAWLKILHDCTDFELKYGAKIAASECTRWPSGHSTMEQAGHDFALTRNGHGAGFWDGDWPEELGKELTQAAKAYGSQNLYVGDDGLIYTYQ